MIRPPYLNVAKEYFEKHHPDARCAFIAGSMLRGEETETSDIDLVILYDDTYQTPHRDSLIFRDWMIELFIHNIAAQNYFLHEDQKGGMPIMIDMILQGHIFGPDTELAEKQKALAKKLFDEGPPLLSEEDIIKRRYFITDALDDIIGAKSSIERQASLAKLYMQLADFYLRTNRKWSGSGKWTIRSLKRADPEMATRYGEAFETAFSGKTDDLVALIHDILSPFGGENRTWKAFAPDDWKTKVNL